LTDSLPAGLTNIQSSAGNVQGGTLTDNIGNLGAGASVTVTITGTFAANVADGSSLHDNTSVTATTTDPVTTNNSAQVTTLVSARADVSVTDGAAPTAAVAGQTVT